MHYKIGVTCYIHWTWVIYSVVITWQSNPPISQFSIPCNECTWVSGQSSYAVLSYVVVISRHIILIRGHR